MRPADERRLAVGFFDGVHLGHRAILSAADVALTFDVHPLSVVDPARAPRLLMALEERIAAIRACGVREVEVLSFTPDLAKTAADDFLSTLKARCGDGRRLVVRCGQNWRFGANGAGDAGFLRSRGIGVEVVPYAVVRDKPVSSSRIRRCLAEGDVATANEQLGRRYAVSGGVVHGKGLGRSLGFPTLNMDVGRLLNLRPGAYAVEVAGRRGVANYGLAPTMGADAWPQPTLEVHLLDGVPRPDVSSVSVEFIRFLRDERKFATTDDLARQISDDCEAARTLDGDTAPTRQT